MTLTPIEPESLEVLLELAVARNWKLVIASSAKIEGGSMCTIWANNPAGSNDCLSMEGAGSVYKAVERAYYAATENSKVKA